MKKYDIDNLLLNINFEKNKLKKNKYNLLLTNYEIEILNKYKITYDNCKSEKEILQAIENIMPWLELEEQEQLEQISISIAERDYYKNTRK